MSPAPDDHAVTQGVVNATTPGTDHTGAVIIKLIILTTKPTGRAYIPHMAVGCSIPTLRRQIPKNIARHTRQWDVKLFALSLDIHLWINCQK